MGQANSTVQEAICCGQHRDTRDDEPGHLSYGPNVSSGASPPKMPTPVSTTPAEHTRAYANGTSGQSSISSVPVSRKLGLVWKRGEWNTGFLERYFVIDKDQPLQYFESKRAFDSGHKAKGEIVLAGCKVYKSSDANPRQHLPGHGHSAKFMHSDHNVDESLWQWVIEDGASHRKFELGCKTEKERREWIHIVQRLSSAGPTMIRAPC